MTRIGIVGAGAASAAATYVLDQMTDAEITVLEKSRGVCGRAATRRHEDLTYDYGANYLKDDDERVVDLLTESIDDEGLVDTEGPIYTFDESGAVSEGRDADDHKWSYRTGLTQVAKRLFGQTDATIHHQTRVETLRREDDVWGVTDTDGKRWGPFDALLLNPPAPQTADLLATAEWNDDLRGTLESAVEAVPYRAVWTAVLHYDDLELDVPYYGLVNTDKDHEIGWVSREECKPGHVPDGETLLIVQANHEWSLGHYDDDPGANVAELAEMTADVIGDDRLTDPDWTDHQGWRYALPEDGVEMGPVENAEDQDLYCTGDWIPGEGRLHAALRDGLETGERVADRA